MPWIIMTGNSMLDNRWESLDFQHLSCKHKPSVRPSLYMTHTRPPDNTAQTRPSSPSLSPAPSLRPPFLPASRAPRPRHGRHAVTVCQSSVRGMRRADPVHGRTLRWVSCTSSSESQVRCGEGAPSPTAETIHCSGRSSCRWVNHPRSMGDEKGQGIEALMGAG